MVPSLDAIVVGAGVIGASVALELTRAGYVVMVLDRDAAPGHGSTGASSAVVRYHYRHRDEAVLAWESGARWARWAEYLGEVDPLGTATFVNTGLLLLSGELLDLTDPRTHMQALGITVEKLDGDQVRERFPAIDPGRLGPPSLPADDRFWADPRGDVVAYWMPECGFVNDPQLAAHNLACAAEAHGAGFRFRSVVVEVVRERNRVAGVRLSSGELLEAPIVVNASGPWSASLNELAGVLGDFSTSTRPLQQEVITLPAPKDFRLGAGGVCVTDADLGTYFRPEMGDTLLVGGMEPPCDPLIWLDSPADARVSVTQSTWNVQSLRAARRLPGIGVPGRSRGIVGVYDVTADWIPIYDRTNLDGYYVAIGTSGHGFKQAPFVGELMASLISACEAGHPHDREPVVVPASWTGHSVDMGHFSRLRKVVAQDGMG